MTSKSLINSQIVKQILSLDSYDEYTYSDIDLNRLALVGISRLNQINIPYTFERLSTLLSRLFPEKFSMAEFTMCPDLTRTNRALLQLRPKYRNWARGDVKNGFQLTETGTSELLLTLELLKRSPNTVSKSTSKRSALPADNRRDRSLIFMAEIERSKLYQSFKDKENQNYSVWDFYDLLHASAEISKETLIKNIQKLESYAEGLKRNDILEFINWVKVEFSEYLEN